MSIKVRLQKIEEHIPQIPTDESGKELTPLECWRRELVYPTFGNVGILEVESINDIPANERENCIPIGYMGDKDEYCKEIRNI